MADALDRVLVAKSGCNETQAGRVHEENWIGRIDDDARAGGVCGWGLYRGLESARGTYDRPTQGQSVLRTSSQFIDTSLLTR